MYTVVPVIEKERLRSNGCIKFSAVVNAETFDMANNSSKVIYGFTHKIRFSIADRRSDRVLCACLRAIRFHCFS